ncbi:hypothetical protein [Paenibacillus pinistramenti]|uniref:hypothetical protein n=1 Tax=Paenibacillus pinistramenti TaxID=1768003 RepID=UPI001107C2B5|nr:hypothetical protein [Paenibacillus pinistramenti]
MFLTDWLNWMDQYPLRAAAVIASVLLFVWLYVTAARFWRRNEEARLSRLRESLERFGTAGYEIRRQLARQDGLEGPEELAENAELADSLLSCQAAPYSSSNLREQIGIYLKRGDASRLEPLLRLLNREAHQLAEEYEALLEAAEQPGWGRSLLRLLQPALPFLLVAAGVLLGVWLALDLADLPPSDAPDYAWTIACLVMRTASGLFSLLMLGHALLVSRRPAPGAGLQRWLALLIAALFAVHSAGLEAAPYTLTLQLLLFPLGFWNQGKPRKSRPFAGHYELAGLDGSSQPADSSQASSLEKDLEPSVLHSRE